MSPRTAITATLLLAAGCGELPPPVPFAFRAARTATHFGGSPLSGPVDLAVDPGRPDQAWRVALTSLGLGELPAGALEPLGPHTRLIVRAFESPPLGVSSTRIAGARVGRVDGGEAFLAGLAPLAGGRLASAVFQRGVLPRGVSARFALEWERPWPGRARPRSEGLEVVICRGGAPGAEELQVALEIREDQPADSSRPEADEVIVLEPFPLAVDLAIALLIPTPFGDAPSGALAVLLEIGPPPVPGSPGYAEHQVDFARCIGDLARSRAQAAYLERPLEGAEQPRDPFGQALEALRANPESRQALHALARASGAELVADMALCSDEACHSGLLQLLAGGGLPREPGLEAGRVGWNLESSGLRLLMGYLLERRLTPAMRALLIRHLGAVALRISSLRALLKEAGNLVQMHAFLLAENRHLLATGEPALRLRAREWLQARSPAPEATASREGASAKPSGQGGVER